ncbi:MAG: membrane protein insertion efficiency factor YidD [Bacteriovoracaceae bacterium]|nr:membrane protein insertion efficiency factor YidD [Bacteriovoracaceae bacterium]
MIKYIFLIPIKFYQLFISPFLGRNCRFQPTCSEYAKECFEKFPLPKALWYSSKRLAKCHPFHSGGFDPVDCECSSH